MRRSLIALVAAAGLLAAGCGDKVARETYAPDEGTIVDVGPLAYQVQISRYLNPGDDEDKAYLSGLPAGTALDERGELWFGVFVRIKNYSKQTQTVAPASSYTIKDTVGHTFNPLQLDRSRNWYAYTPQKVLPAGWFPNQETTAGINPIAGELLLYKLPVADVQNRPLELHINNAGKSAIVSLDL